MKSRSVALKTACRILAESCRLDISFVWNALESFDNKSYQKIRKPKKGGGTRVLHEPCEMLKIVQSAMLPRLYRWPVDEQMFGYVPGRSVVGNARHHLWTFNDFSGTRYRAPYWVVSLDLKDAFPSVTYSMLKKIYLSILKSSNFRREAKNEGMDAQNLYLEFVHLLLKLTTLNGRLPQGAPTSPYLLNVALTWTGMARRVADVCNGYSSPLQFSFYSDDITVSSRKMIISDRAINRLITAIEKDGNFKVNYDKTRRNCIKNRAHKITGVVLDRDRQYYPIMTLSQKALKSWRGSINRATAIMLQSNLPFIVGDDLLIERARGYINWIREVYEEDKIPASVRGVISEFEEVWLRYKEAKNRD